MAYTIFEDERDLVMNAQPIRRFALTFRICLSTVKMA